MKTYLIALLFLAAATTAVNAETFTAPVTDSQSPTEQLRSRLQWKTDGGRVLSVKRVRRLICGRTRAANFQRRSRLY